MEPHHTGDGPTTAGNTAERAAGAVIRQMARAFERDRYLAALLAPGDVRDDLLVLAAFAGEVARIPGYVNEPTIGAIRLQWWVDAIQAMPEGRAGQVTGHPLADALADLVRRRGLSSDLLIGVVEAQIDRLADVPFADMHELIGNIAKSDGALFSLALRITAAARCDAVDPVLDSAGLSYGLARVVLEAPVLLSDGRCLIPVDILRRLDLLDQSGLSLKAGPDPQISGRLDTACADVVAIAQHELAKVRGRWRGQPWPWRLAALPVALVQPYLSLCQKPAQGALRARDVVPLTRVIRLWAAGTLALI